MQKSLPKDFDDDDLDSMMDEDEYKELFRMDYKTIFTDVINSEVYTNFFCFTIFRSIKRWLLIF